MNTTEENPTTTVIWRKGKQVTLRPFLESDLPIFQRWINDPSNNQFLSVTWPMHRAGQEKWLESITQSDSSNICLAICTHDGLLIGNTGLHIKTENHSAETGTLIGENEYRSRGYGTDAKMLLLDYAFNWRGIRKVTSRIWAFNGRSQKYAQKCGYRHMATIEQEIFRAGQWQDEEHYVVFRDEWLPLWTEYCAGDWSPVWENNIL